MCPEGDTKKWGRGNIIKNLTAENFTKLLKDIKPQKTPQLNKTQ